jgi:hypothetical protein
MRLHGIQVTRTSKAVVVVIRVHQVGELQLFEIAQALNPVRFGFGLGKRR